MAYKTKAQKLQEEKFYRNIKRIGDLAREYRQRWTLLGKPHTIAQSLKTARRFVAIFPIE